MASPTSGLYQLFGGPAQTGQGSPQWTPQMQNAVNQGPRGGQNWWNRRMSQGAPAQAIEQIQGQLQNQQALQNQKAQMGPVNTGTQGPQQSGYGGYGNTYAPNGPQQTRGGYGAVSALQQYLGQGVQQGGQFGPPQGGGGDNFASPGGQSFLSMPPGGGSPWTGRTMQGSPNMGGPPPMQGAQGLSAAGGFGRGFSPVPQGGQVQPTAPTPSMQFQGGLGPGFRNSGRQYYGEQQGQQY